jgi:beta-galactosidase
MKVKEFVIALLAGRLALKCSAAAQNPRERFLADHGWRFLLGDPADAQDPKLDDHSWRVVDLPHDWSIEGTFDAKNPMGGVNGS